MESSVLCSKCCSILEPPELNIFWIIMAPEWNKLNELIQISLNRLLILKLRWSITLKLPFYTILTKN